MIIFNQHLWFLTSHRLIGDFLYRFVCPRSPFIFLFFPLSPRTQIQVESYFSACLFIQSIVVRLFFLRQPNNDPSGLFLLPLFTQAHFVHFQSCSLIFHFLSTFTQEKSFLFFCLTFRFEDVLNLKSNFILIFSLIRKI